MNAPFSSYLQSIAPCMKQVISLLGASFDYVSILSTDSVGWRIAIGQRSKAVTNTVARQHTITSTKKPG